MKTVDESVFTAGIYTNCSSRYNSMAEAANQPYASCWSWI